MKFRCASLTDDSIVNGPGIRYVIWTQGCIHHCKGCHNPETWDKTKGYEEDTDVIFEKIKNNFLLDGITFSGGDPFEQCVPLSHLAGRIHKETKLSVLAFTGYTYEYLIENSNNDNHFMDLLKECDYLVDGPFVKDLQSYELAFRGSSNQRFIDVKKSLKTGKTVIVPEMLIEMLS